MIHAPAGHFAAELILCDLCDGVGDVDCLQCGGSGSTDPIGGPATTCPSCTGIGFVTCPECEGCGSMATPAPRHA